MTMARQETVQMKALSAKERGEVKEWKEHYRGGHYPYRRDCVV